MSINPLIPYIPAFLSFFIYGYLSGFLFLLWKRSRWGCLLTIIFWEAYIVWCIFISMFLGVQETSDQTWFVLGGALAFLRPLLQSVAVQNFIEDITHAGHLGRRAWQALTRSRTKATSSGTQNQTNQNHQQTYQNQQSQQTNHGYNQYNDTTEQARRAEQARREAEARARRAEKEKENQQSREDDPKPEPPTADTRTPEEILGLKAGWTQEDLIKIYRSEAQRTHPDKWIGKPASVRHAMEEEFKNIRRAFDQLKT
jgi:DnaJ domain